MLLVVAALLALSGGAAAQLAGQAHQDAAVAMAAECPQHQSPSCEELTEAAVVPPRIGTPMPGGELTAVGAVAPPAPAPAVGARGTPARAASGAALLVAIGVSRS